MLKSKLHFKCYDISENRKIVRIYKTSQDQKATTVSFNQTKINNCKGFITLYIYI